ncbi:MAG: HEAT repeat domain-containing protein [bacterium]
MKKNNSIGDKTVTRNYHIDEKNLLIENIPAHLMRIETIERITRSLKNLEEEQQITAIKTIFAMVHRLEIDLRPFFEFSGYEHQIVKILHESSDNIFEALFSYLPDKFFHERLPHLLDLVCHPSEQVRFKFHQRLQTFEPREILKTLEETNNKIDETGKISIATIIAEKELALALPLLEKLAVSENSDIRIVVAQCLALEANSKSLSLLYKLANDEDLAVQESAYYALALNSNVTQIEIFENGLQHELTSIKEICADAIAKIDQDRFIALLADYLSLQSEEDILFALMLAAKHPNELIFDDIVNLATSDNADIRTQVARTLVGFNSKETYEPLKGLFADPERDVRLAAFESLLEIAHGNNELPLHTALQDHDHLIQIAALDAAVVLRRTDLIAAIFPLVLSGSKMVQSRAIDSLVRLKGLDILPEIQRTLVLHGQDADALLEHVVEDTFATL